MMEEGTGPLPVTRDEGTPARTPPPEWGTIAGAIVLLATALVCTQVPLVNALGYESSVTIALVASFVSAMLVIGGFRRMLRSGGGEGSWEKKHVQRLFRERLVTVEALLLVPLFVLAANAWFVKNCSFTQGLAFFLLLPVVSVWFSAALGLFCAVQYKRSRLAFSFFFLLTLAYALWTGYATPAIFSYNVFYGYFPGLSYDEALGITLPLLLFRLVTVALGGVFLWLSLLIVRRSRPSDGTAAKGATLLRTLLAPEWRVLSGAVFLTLLLLYLFRCEFGWESTSGFIAEQLGGEMRTEHFVIRYRPEEIPPSDARRLAGEHEFRLAQLMRDFGVRALDGPVTSFIYPDASTKRRFIGTSTTNIAKPWNNEIHLTRQTVEVTLKHELAHVVAGHFGEPVIRANLSTGLVEGLATAQEWVWGNRTLHEHAASMLAIGILPDLRRVMSPVGFATRSPGAAYVSAGSFCRYLIDAYGVKPLLAVYGGARYDTAFRRPLDSLVIEWERFLGRLRVEEGDRASAEFYFQRPTIFVKPCARVSALWNEEASGAMARGAYAEAREAYRHGYEETKGLEAFGGLLRATFRTGDYEGVARLYENVILRSSHPAQYLPLLVWCGDARWVLGDAGGARELYVRVLAADLSESLTEAAALRLAVMENSPRTSEWLGYFCAEPVDSVRLRLLDSLSLAPDSTGIARYLRGRILARTNKPAPALEALEQVDLLRVSPILEAIRQTTVAREWYLLGKYNAARPAFWMSQNVLTSEASVIQAREWVSRCDWMRVHKY
jgi:tetratricopeptide (TPR) repeat protein